MLIKSTLLAIAAVACNTGIAQQSLKVPVASESAGVTNPFLKGNIKATCSDSYSVTGIIVTSTDPYQLGSQVGMPSFYYHDYLYTNLPSAGTLLSSKTLFKINKSGVLPTCKPIDIKVFGSSLVSYKPSSTKKNVWISHPITINCFAIKASSSTPIACGTISASKDLSRQNIAMQTMHSDVDYYINVTKSYTVPGKTRTTIPEERSAENSDVNAYFLSTNIYTLGANDNYNNLLPVTAQGVVHRLK